MGIIKKALRYAIRLTCQVISCPGYVIRSVAAHCNHKNETTYNDMISVVAIAKNEKDYIREWVEFYRVLGIDRIYLFDNGSSDGMKEKIADYIDNGFVVYTYFPGIGVQFSAYNTALKKYRKQTKYMAFLDCDEFLMPCSINEKLDDIINDILGNTSCGGGIAVNWRMYGSSGHIEKPDGLVLESYLYRANDKNGAGNNCIKTIANPRCVYKFNHAHFPIYYLGFHAVDENGKTTKGAFHACDKCKRLRINHYFTKSKSEWIKRRALGKADAKDKTNVRSIEEFYAHDNNDVYDEIGLYWADKIKESHIVVGKKY